MGDDTLNNFNKDRAIDCIWVTVRDDNMSAVFVELRDSTGEVMLEKNMGEDVASAWDHAYELAGALGMSRDDVDGDVFEVTG